MTKAKVYFSDMRTRYGGLSLPQKLGKLIEAAGIGDIDFQNKFAAQFCSYYTGSRNVCIPYFQKIRMGKAGCGCDSQALVLLF